MADKVKKIMESGSFDAVHADQLWMAQYAFIAKTVKADVRLILDEHNACFQIFQRLAESEKNFLKKFLLKREWQALQRYEAWACSQFDHVVTVTDEDQNTLKSMVTPELSTKETCKFSTIPICVNTQEVRPVQPEAATKNVFHLGTMFYLPNITGMLWFVREVWPRVLAQVPQATLTIAGKNPPAVIQQLSSSGPDGSYSSYRLLARSPAPSGTCKCIHRPFVSWWRYAGQDHRSMALGTAGCINLNGCRRHRISQRRKYSDCRRRRSLCQCGCASVIRTRFRSIFTREWASLG
jgi:hypothetical protein